MWYKDIGFPKRESFQGPGASPRLSFYDWSSAVSELSILVDESGDMGTVSKYYLITLVFHDQSDSLLPRITSYELALGQRSLPNLAFHLSPLINAHDEYSHMGTNERRKLLSTFRSFADHLPFRYHTFSYKKSEFPNNDSMLSRMKRDLVVFLFDNLDYFQSFNTVKVYYDNGQPLVSTALHQAIDYALSRDAVVYRDASPANYRLMQVADYACGVELTAMKFQVHEQTATDAIFFGKWADFKRNHLRKLRRHLI